MPFLAIERSPAVLATAGAGYSAAWSAFGNSAFLPFSEVKMDAAASWQNWAPSGSHSTNINAGAAYRLSDGFALSVAFASQGGDGYDIVSDSGVSKGSFKPSDMIVGAGAGFRFGENLSAGVSVRFASQKLSPDASYSAVAAGADVMYASGSLKASAGIHNIGTPVTSADGTKYPVPASANLTGSYAHGLGDSGSIAASLTADCFLSGGISAGLGVEYAFRNMVFARAGYHLGTQTAVLPSFVTLGLGGKFAGISIDLACLLGNETLGGTLALGLGYSF